MDLNTGQIISQTLTQQKKKKPKTLARQKSLCGWPCYLVFN